MVVVRVVALIITMKLAKLGRAWWYKVACKGEMHPIVELGVTIEEEQELTRTRSTC